jgi:hypothetical protein
MTLHFSIIRNFFFITFILFTVFSSCYTVNSTKQIKVWIFFSLGYPIIIRWKIIYYTKIISLLFDLVIIQFQIVYYKYQVIHFSLVQTISSFYMNLNKQFKFIRFLSNISTFKIKKIKKTCNFKCTSVTLTSRWSTSQA